MLKELQKSVEDEEQVWKAKLSNTEEDLQKVCLEAWLAAQREGIGLPHFLPGLSPCHPVWFPECTRGEPYAPPGVAPKRQSRKPKCRMVS